MPHSVYKYTVIGCHRIPQSYSSASAQFD